LAKPENGGQSDLGHPDYVLSTRFHPNGKTLVSGGHDCNIKFWNTRSGKCIHCLDDAHTGPVLCLDYTPEGDVLASGGKGGNIKLWDTSTYECIRELHGHASQVRYLRFSDDGCWLGSVGYDSNVRLWIFDSEPDTDHRGIPMEEIREVKCMKGHKGHIRCCAWTPDSKILASSGDDKTIRLWSVPEGKCLDVIKGHEDKVFAVAFSLDNKTMSTGAYDDTVKLWNYKTKECLATIPVGSHVLSCDFGPRGQYMVAVGDDKVLHLYHVASRKEVGQLTGHTDSAFGVDFSPVEDLIVSGSHDKTVRIWDWAAALREYGMSAQDKAELEALDHAAWEKENELRRQKE
jgi:WD40 repeat protein